MPWWGRSRETPTRPLPATRTAARSACRCPAAGVLLSDLRARYAEGAYDVGGRPLYVTRGVGTSLLPFRAFCRPEIVVFHGRAGRSEAA